MKNHALDAMLAASCARDARLHFVEAAAPDPSYASVRDALKLPLEAEVMATPAGIELARRVVV